MIHYCEYTPAQALRPFVECLWTLHSCNELVARRELIIPGGRTELIINFRSSLRWLDSKNTATSLIGRGAYLLGQRNRYFFIEATGETNIVGVRFRPGGLAAFTKVPMHTFLNQMVPLADIFGSVSSSWINILLEVSPGKPLIEVLNALLITQLQTNGDTLAALRLISWVKQEAPNASVQALCNQSGVHYKKMERIFTHYTGYTPKNFTRILRFYKTVQALSSSNASLTETGLQYGYYDQSHFIHDFKEFTGISPAQFPFQEASIANLLLQSRYV